MSAALSTSKSIANRNRWDRTHGKKSFIEVPANENIGTFDDGGVGQQVMLQQPEQRNASSKIAVGRAGTRAEHS